MIKQLKPFVIKGNTRFKTITEMEQLREKMNEACKSLKDELLVLPEEYLYTARPFVFPILEKDVILFMRGENDNVYVPSFLLKTPALLEEAYGAIIINNKVYSKEHPDIIQTSDTKKWMFKKDAIRDIQKQQYYEKKQNLIYLPKYDGWADKKEVVTTADTKELDLKSSCHIYKDKKEKIHYYEFHQLRPNEEIKRLHFNKSEFPEPNEIKETRIGIELEYDNSIQASREVLVNKHYRKLWSSVHDGSIPKEGTEFVSVPFKYNQLNEVSDFIEFCNSNGVEIGKKSGFHVHIGAPNLDFMVLTSVVLFCHNIQEELFNLVPDHRKNNRFCRKLDDSFVGFKRVKNAKDEKMVADIFYESAGTNYQNRYKQSKYSVNNKRHYWVNIDRFFMFKETPHLRTIEFRLYPSTKDSKEFMQFILLCYYIFQFCVEKGYNITKNSTLEDLLNWIPNWNDRDQVNSLIISKKSVEYV